MTEGSSSSKRYFDANVFINAVEGSREALPQLIEELS
jgi:hypothetical protein